MIRIRDSLAGDLVKFHCVQSKSDLREVQNFILRNSSLGIDTESTGLNCYRRDWRLRTVQIGNSMDSYVIPQQWTKFIEWIMREPVNWIGHNGTHDIRCIDVHLGYDTGVVCAGETYIPSHHADSRNKMEGGMGHGLKDISMAVIDPQADKWERALKAEFKQIMVPVPGEYYKSGVNKGKPKVRKAKLAEGWSLINPFHPAYLAYAAADPLLTYRVWAYYQSVVREFYDLYKFDHAVDQACDKLQRRAMKLDVSYTERLSDRYTRRAEVLQEVAFTYGCDNIQSTAQIAATLRAMKVELTELTPTGKDKVDSRILRALAADPDVTVSVHRFVNAVLVAKQLLKRRESYTDSMLRERDSQDRVHPSINALAARTARMSISAPPLQQLPTKDRENEVMWDEEEEI
jgi:DNA polymerase I